MEKLTVCASCGSQLEPRPGPGRPSVYCDSGCRRLAEFQIRALLRRLDKAEIELRELKAGSGNYDDDDRRKRIRAVKRWLAEDTAKLRALLSGNNQKGSKNNQIAPEKSAEGFDLVPLEAGDLQPFNFAKSK